MFNKVLDFYLACFTETCVTHHQKIQSLVEQIQVRLNLFFLNNFFPPYNFEGVNVYSLSIHCPVQVQTIQNDRQIIE